MGPNNRLLDQIQGYFPKIRLIARGNEIKCVGEAEEVAHFCREDVRAARLLQALQQAR
ncbi:MAG: hypothetical protein MZV63_02145 [Marinilabiliales bacterium]|nr:hypothetical protein [Marinilabiliales bacterium]